MGGDFNNSPEAVQEWLDKHTVGMRVVAQEKPTFSCGRLASNIDFFVATAEIAAALKKPTVRHGSVLAGHKPVATVISRADLEQCHPRPRA